ncbi:hypothetical protein TNCT_640721 [Trichonephila clavata]|uniref:Uncharacterized protein n=1 Tax=Trichonephila clavata TaxID=2740835 RepID=A0A8X6HVW6_TRICU|nr:hypothetical protein TNCT_640721 [Trichonephila clavata]
MSTISVVSTSSSSTQTGLIPFASPIIPDKASKSRLPMPISITTPGNSLNTSVSSLTSEIQPTVPLLNTTTTKSGTSAVTKAASNLKQSKKNRRKLTSEPKSDIEITMDTT